MEALRSGCKNVDAAYIRIKNNGEEASQITLNDFKVTYKFVGAKKVDTDFEKHRMQMICVWQELLEMYLMEN